MCVQYDEVSPKAIQDIVFYCLTPVRFRRYSSLNLCAASPAGNEKRLYAAEMSIVSGLGGILLVNRFYSAVSIPMFRKTGAWLRPKLTHGATVLITGYCN